MSELTPVDTYQAADPVCPPLPEVIVHECDQFEGYSRRRSLRPTP
ncbi:MAG TPA: hypothetical protein VFT17_13445 [Propionibacteriaceae bacterium]|nr:hypothetical protein [Propionibacteriaceae bacterium]